MQFRLMSQQINQLKDEISQKDAAKQFEDGERAGHVATNDRHKKNIRAIEQQLKSSDDMIKTQENDIARLKYVISEAEQEQ